MEERETLQGVRESLREAAPVESPREERESLREEVQVESPQEERDESLQEEG